MRDFEKAVTDYLAREGKCFTAETDLFEANVLDSMEILALVAFIEDELGVRLDQEDLVIEKFRSVNAIVHTLGMKN